MKNLEQINIYKHWTNFFILNLILELCVYVFVNVCVCLYIHKHPKKKWRTLENSDTHADI